MKPVSHVANLFGLIFKVNAPVGTDTSLSSAQQRWDQKILKQRLAIESVTIAKWNQQKHSQIKSLKCNYSMLEDDAKMSIRYHSQLLDDADQFPAPASQLGSDRRCVDSLQRGP